MKEYTFTLTFKLAKPTIDPYGYVYDLCEAGCDEAIVAAGSPGFIALIFTSSSVTLHKAIFDCAERVLQAIPDAELIEVEP